MKFSHFVDTGIEIRFQSVKIRVRFQNFENVDSDSDSKIAQLYRTQTWPEFLSGPQLKCEPENYKFLKPDPNPNPRFLTQTGPEPDPIKSSGPGPKPEHDLSFLSEPELEPDPD